jgi:hypothetical protein
MKAIQFNIWIVLSEKRTTLFASFVNVISVLKRLLLARHFNSSHLIRKHLYIRKQW